MSAAAHRCAQAASERSRPGWFPAAIGSLAAVSGPTQWRESRPEGADGHQRDEQLVEALQLAVQEPRAGLGS